MAYTPDTGSLRIHCLLISYLISTQARLHDFKRVLVHLNLNVIGKKLVPLNRLLISLPGHATLFPKEIFFWRRALRDPAKETFRFEDEDYASTRFDLKLFSANAKNIDTPESFAGNMVISIEGAKLSNI